MLQVSRQGQLFETEAILPVAQPDLYIRAFGNSALLALLTNRHDAFRGWMQKLGGLVPGQVNLSQYQEYLLYLLELMHYTTTGQYRKAVEFIEGRQNRIRDLEDQMKRQQVNNLERNYAVFHQTIAYMGIQDFEQALLINNEYLNMAPENLKQDFHSMARIINLLIYVEMDDWDILEYRLTSTYRYLKQRNRLFAFERAVMKFIRQVIRAYQKEEMEHALKTLYRDLQRLRKDPYERNVFLFFDFLSWLEAKLAGISMEQLFLQSPSPR